MRAQRFYLLGLFIAAVLCLPRSGEAQTTAVGPYYATPSWDQTLVCTMPSNCPRFVVLANFDNNAVLDRESGLVWERSPSETRIRADFDECVELSIGSREGWRMPTVSELRSLIDSSQSNPALPPGHPFTNLHIAVDDLYWTSTQDLLNPGNLLLVSVGIRNSEGSSVPSVAFGRQWCVRGPSTGGR